MIIRPYKKSDIELITPLYDEFVKLNKSLSYKENSREMYLNWLHNAYDELDCTVFVVEDKETIIGFAVGIIQQNKPLLLPDRIGYIGMFIVQSGHRRKGIGRSLYQKLLDWFQSKEISEIQLTTEIHNETAKKFWTSIGFNATYEQRAINI